MIEIFAHDPQVLAVHQCTEDLRAIIYHVQFKANLSQEAVAVWAASNEALNLRYSSKFEVVFAVVDMYCFSSLLSQSIQSISHSPILW